MPAKSQLMKLLINSTHTDLLYLEKTKNTIWLNQSDFFQPKNICPNLPPKPPNPPKKERLNQHFSSRFHRAHFAPKELDMTLIALNTSKEQQVFWTLTEWQGRFVWCFVLMLKHVFLEEKHEELKNWSWKLNIEWRCSHFVHALQSTYSWHIPTGFCWLKFRCSEKNGGGPRSKENNTWIFFEGTLRIHVWEYSPTFGWFLWYM